MSLLLQCGVTCATHASSTGRPPDCVCCRGASTISAGGPATVDQSIHRRQRCRHTGRRAVPAGMRLLSRCRRKRRHARARSDDRVVEPRRLGRRTVRARSRRRAGDRDAAEQAADEEIWQIITYLRTVQQPAAATAGDRGARRDAVFRRRPAARPATWSTAAAAGWGRNCRASAPRDRAPTWSSRSGEPNRKLTQNASFGERHTEVRHGDGA